MRTAINSVLPVAAGRGLTRAIRPETFTGRLGTEAVGGAVGNVIPSAIEQQAFEGRINPAELARQAVIGGVASTATALPAIRAGQVRGERLAPPELQRPATRRQTEVIPISRAQQVAEPVPSASESAPPTLPKGLRVIREGEAIPPRVRGMRQIPIEVNRSDGTTETVMVVAPERIDGQRATESVLRTFAEQAVNPPLQPPQQPPAQPPAPVAPIPIPEPVARAKAGADVEVFPAGQQPEFDPATQKVITFRGPDRQDYGAIVPKGMSRADATAFGRAKIPAPAPQAQRPQLPTEQQPPPLLRPEAQVNLEGGIPSQKEAPVDFKAPARAPVDKGSNVSLEQFVINEGGIKRSDYDRGEVKYLTGREGGRPGVVSDRGIFADDLRQRANEAGYGPFDTVDDFMRAVTNQGRTAKPTSFQPDIEAARRAEMSDIEAADTDAFQKMLDDPPIAKAYDEIVSGRADPERIAEFIEGSQRYGMSARGMAEVLAAGRPQPEAAPAIPEAPQPAPRQEAAPAPEIRQTAQPEPVRPREEPRPVQPVEQPRPIEQSPARTSAAIDP
ncbi:MAG: hypothetical protein L0Z53_23235, partial [Acidobacteriales bacterium]|nr:hypothetical protein [Terriglobales bacterium]